MVGRSEKKLATVRCRAKLKKKIYHESNGLLLELLSSGLLADLAGFLPLAQLGLGLGLCFLFVVPTAAWQAHESLELALLVVNFRGFAEVEVLNGGLSKETMSWRVASALAWALEPVLREVVVSSVS